MSCGNQSLDEQNEIIKAINYMNTVYSNLNNDICEKKKVIQSIIEKGITLDDINMNSTTDQDKIDMNQLSKADDLLEQLGNINKHFKANDIVGAVNDISTLSKQIDEHKDDHTKRQNKPSSSLPLKLIKTAEELRNIETLKELKWITAYIASFCSAAVVLNYDLKNDQGSKERMEYVIQQCKTVNIQCEVVKGSILMIRNPFQIEKDQYNLCSILHTIYEKAQRLVLLETYTSESFEYMDELNEKDIQILKKLGYLIECRENYCIVTI
jgi:hypothetical protein